MEISLTLRFYLGHRTTHIVANLQGNYPLTAETERMPPNKEQRERLQSWLDSGKELRNHGPNIVERVWDPRSALEGYRKGDLEAHYHIGIRSRLLTENPKYFCVRLKSEGQHCSSTERTPRLHVSDDEVVSFDHLRIQMMGVLGEDRLDFSVLVSSHKFVEHEKGMEVSHRTPPVRLVRLDDCPMHRSDTGQPSVGLPCEIPTIATDDELRRTRTPEMWFGSPTHEVMGQVVQGGTEVREGVPDDEAPSSGHLRNAGDGVREAVQVTLELFPEPVRWFSVTCGPSKHVCLEFVRVFLRPVELMPTTVIQSVHEL
jgi:hypothetical protein